MKKFVFLMLTFSSFLAAACGDDSIQSAGGPVTDGKGSVQANSGLSASSSGLVGTDCIDLPPITVTGFAYFSIQRLVIGVSYALNSSGGDFGDLDQDAGCDNLSYEQRFDVATAAFTAAGIVARGSGNQRRFCRKYPPGGTFEFTFPSGETADYRGFSCMPSQRPLSLEITGSCG